MFPVAILQGRLSPDTEKRFQFFPSDWSAEFPIAARLGFAGIEWLVDARGWQHNPVHTDDFSKIAMRASEAGAPIVSIAADWFMEECLWEGDPESHRAALRRVISAARHTKNKLIQLPLLEKHTITGEREQASVLDVLKPLVPELDAVGVTLAFEQELGAPALAAFIDAFESDRVGAYFDTGNCTSYGFDCPADIRALGSRVKGVHLKDRKIGTTQNVPFGTGDADFRGILAALKEVGWRGTLIMQGWRGEDYIADAAKQREYIMMIQNEADL